MLQLALDEEEHSANKNENSSISRSGIKRLMHNCFMIMMSKRLLFSEDDLLRSLKSISFYLKKTLNLSDGDVDYALYCFWDEYNTGCNPPMSQEHISNRLIPAIYAYPTLDITIGGNILDLAYDAM